MGQAISDRPEVDKFRFELYDHLGIDETQIDERDFIHEMAHSLYNKAHMKGSGLTKASEVRVDNIVRPNKEELMAIISDALYSSGISLPDNCDNISENIVVALRERDVHIAKDLA